MRREQKNNSFALFRNDRKEKNTHPDMQGNALVDGVEYWLSAWTHVSEKDGSKYLTGELKPKEQPRNRRDDPPQRSSGVRRSFKDDMNDDIPF